MTTQKNSRLLFSLEPRSVETPTRPARVYFLSWWILSLVYRHRSGSNWSWGCLCLKKGKCGKVIHILREITVSPILCFDYYDRWPSRGSVSRSEKLEKKASAAVLLFLWHKKTKLPFYEARWKTDLMTSSSPFISSPSWSPPQCLLYFVVCFLSPPPPAIFSCKE